MSNGNHPICLTCWTKKKSKWERIFGGQKELLVIQSPVRNRADIGYCRECFICHGTTRGGLFVACNEQIVQPNHAVCRENLT